jgi:hypothetical protein
MKCIFSACAIAALLVNIAGCSNDPATTSADALPPSNAPAPAAAEPVKVEPKTTIAAGTKLRVTLLDAVSSDKSRPGDPFMASLTEPVVINGKTIFAKGTKVRGRVVSASESGRVKGRAMLELKLTEIAGKGGHFIGISTKHYTAVAEPTKKRDAAIIGGGAGVGAAIGALTGGGKGAAIGAAVGGGAGTGTVLATKGKEIRFAPEHPLSFTLASPFEI